MSPCNTASAVFSETELVCEILSTMPNRNKMMDCTDVCWKNNNVQSNVRVLKSQLIRGVNCGQDYKHHYMKKTRLELTRISAAVMGIEVSYSE